jgi:hypothetical protein
MACPSLPFLSSASTVYSDFSWTFAYVAFVYDFSLCDCAACRLVYPREPSQPQPQPQPLPLQQPLLVPALHETPHLHNQQHLAYYDDQFLDFPSTQALGDSFYSICFKFMERHSPRIDTRLRQRGIQRWQLAADPNP